MPYFPQHLQWEKFEIVFYDSTALGPSRDNVFVMQYATAQNIGSVGCGLQNHDRNSGLTYLQNAAYPRQAAVIVPGRAVKYRASPLSGIREMSNDECRMTNVALRCRPNPTQGRAELSLDLPQRWSREGGVYDAAGRLGQDDCGAGDGRGPARPGLGRDAVREGVYFCRVSTAAGKAAVKLVVAR